MAAVLGRDGRLKGFRLADVPIDLRLRAARQVARATDRALADDGVKPEDRLFSRLSDLAAHGDDVGAASLERIASDPSDLVYWVSRAAWDRVMKGRP